MMMFQHWSLWRCHRRSVTFTSQSWLTTERGSSWSSVMVPTSTTHGVTTWSPASRTAPPPCWQPCPLTTWRLQRSVTSVSPGDLRRKLGINRGVYRIFCLFSVSVISWEWLTVSCDVLFMINSCDIQSNNSYYLVWCLMTVWLSHVTSCPMGVMISCDILSNGSVIISCDILSNDIVIISCDYLV